LRGENGGRSNGTRGSHPARSAKGRSQAAAHRRSTAEALCVGGARPAAALCEFHRRFLVVGSVPGRHRALWNPRLHGEPAHARDRAPHGPRCSTPRRAFLDHPPGPRSEEHTSELQSRQYLVCRLLLEKKKHKTSSLSLLKKKKKKHIH